MNQKPEKVEETATPYAAKQPAKPEAGSRSAESRGQQVNDEAFEAVADRIFLERKALLRKLAQ